MLCIAGGRAPEMRRLYTKSAKVSLSYAILSRYEEASNSLSLASPPSSLKARSSHGRSLSNVVHNSSLGVRPVSHPWDLLRIHRVIAEPINGAISRCGRRSRGLHGRTFRLHDTSADLRGGSAPDTLGEHISRNST